MKTKNLAVYLLIAALGSSIFTVAALKLSGLDRRTVVLQEVSKGDSPENLAQFAKKDPDLKSTKFNVPVDFTAAAEKVTPMVVHIVATQDMSHTNLRRNEDIPDLFRDFFGDDFGREFRNRGPQNATGSGSGVIISQDGYIVTNNHVVENASKVEVILNDKRSYKADVIGTAPATDLAVLKINEKNLPNIILGNSDEVKVGEWVLAVGNPFNLESTVTAGIVSAKGRSLNILRDKDKAPIEAFIQTDAAVNPGNSGGALVNVRGELIGINTAIATPTGTYAGYSFAIPVNIAKKVIKDLIEYGSVQRGYLGVTIRQLDGKFAQELGLKNISEGVYVENFATNSAARDAGIQPGDVIVAIDGRKIKTSPELLEEVAKRRPGDKVAVEVIRNGNPKTFQVFLKGQDGEMEVAEKKGNDIQRLLGAELEDLSAEEKRKLGITGGVKISRLFSGKLSKQTDMREGFVVTKMGGEPVKNKEEFLSKLSRIKGGVFLSGVYPDAEGEYYYAFGM